MIPIKQLSLAAALLLGISQHFVVAEADDSRDLEIRTETDAGNNIAQARDVQLRGLFEDDFFNFDSHSHWGRSRSRGRGRGRGRSRKSRANHYSRMQVSGSMSQTICRPGEKCKTEEWSSCKVGDGSGGMRNCKQGGSKGRRIGSGGRRGKGRKTSKPFRIDFDEFF